MEDDDASARTRNVLKNSSLIRSVGNSLGGGQNFWVCRVAGGDSFKKASVYVTS